MTKRLHLILMVLSFVTGFSQPISTFQQFTGSYDFTMIGNTMNAAPNGTGAACMMLTQSSAMLNLAPNQTVEAAYLYWSGSGNLQQADLNVNLNGVPITAQRTFTVDYAGIYPFFGAYADVTNILRTTGNGLYTLSNFDINAVLPHYCPGGLNYAGWAIVIVYEDPTLLNRVVNLYDGFEIVDPNNQFISITLSGLNVTDIAGAKLGFLAWEGDANIAISEELRINNSLVSNPPLNPANNVFNGTNSYTNSNTLYNMDLDYFMISNYISLGDTSLNFSIRSAQDLIISNAFAVSLTSLFADATIEIDDVKVECASREITVDYTVYNHEGTTDLLPNVPIAFYADDVLVGTTTTRTTIPIGGSESASLKINLPSNIAEEFVLKLVVDDDGTGKGIIVELDEENNEDETSVRLLKNPQIGKPEDLFACDENKRGYIHFDLTINTPLVRLDPNHKITYYESEKRAAEQENPITNPMDYEVESFSYKRIWIRVDDPITGCFSITSFRVTAKKKVFGEMEQPFMICSKKDRSTHANLDVVYRILSQKVDFVDEIDFSFYTSWQDAQDEVNEIKETSDFKVPYYPFIVYVKAKGGEALWCDDLIEIQINQCVVPRGISPNSDRLNDGLDLTNFYLNDLKIYNRYGNLVYEYGEGYTNQWKGHDRNGKILPAGTYFIVFQTDFDTYTGYVYVIREKP